MKIIFAGTPAFAVPTLQALLASEHEIKLVLTQPDRPAGRGQKMQFSPVKEVAVQHGLPVLQPTTLKNPEIQELLKQQQADVMVVVAYGLLLPEAVLNIPQHGCINVHASLLPRWRGAAPIPYAILSGDKTTGITIMKMDKGLDTGDMLLLDSLPIGPQDTTARLHDPLSQMGARLLLKTLENLEKTGKLIGTKQNDAESTHAGKINKEQARLDWYAPAETLVRKVHAFNPWPVAYFHLDDDSAVRVWEAEAIATTPKVPPGTIIEATAKHLYVACETGIFSPRILQFPGKNPLEWNSVFNSRRHLFTEGTLLK